MYPKIGIGLGLYNGSTSITNTSSFSSSSTISDGNVY